jgi:phosphatidylserine decarboxylase
MIIAKEAWIPVIVLIVFAYVAWFVSPALTVFLSGLALFVLFFFRDPWRKVPEDRAVVVSPADGTITDVREVEWEGQPYRMVVIFLSVMNVHINRIPFSGTVVSTEHVPGDFHAAYKPDIEMANERMTTVLDTAKGRMKVVQIAGLIARKIINRLQVGQVVKTGERFGLIKFGSRTDVYLPAAAQVLVQKGQTVKGGSTVIARFS